MEAITKYPWGKGTPTWNRDATANDSDKSFTVPEGKIWDLKFVIIEIICTATVGNRILDLSITDGTNVIFTSPPSASITASQYGQLATFRTLGYGGTTARRRLDNINGNVNVELDPPLPDLILPAGYVIRARDAAAVDAAADDMTVILHYVEYDA